MTIDIAVAGTIIVLALLGLFTGFWGQILRLLALGSLYFLAPPFAEWRHIENHVRDALGTQAPEGSVKGMSLIVAAVGLYIVMVILIAIIMAVVMHGKKKSPTNRILGFIMGGLKGTVLCYLLLCGLVLFVRAQETYAERLGTLSGDPVSFGRLMNDIETEAQDSALVDLVGEHNILSALGYDLDDLLSEIVPPVGTPPEGATPTPVQQPPTPAQPAQTPNFPGPNQVVNPGQTPAVPLSPGVVPTQPSIGPGSPASPSVPAITPTILTPK